MSFKIRIKFLAEGEKENLIKQKDDEQREIFFVFLISQHHCLCEITAMMKRNVTCHGETFQDFRLKNIFLASHPNKMRCFSDNTRLFVSFALLLNETINVYHPVYYKKCWLFYFHDWKIDMLTEQVCKRVYSGYNGRNFIRQRNEYEGGRKVLTMRERQETRAVRQKDFRAVSLEKQRAVDGLNPPTTSIRVSETTLHLPFTARR